MKDLRKLFLAGLIVSAFVSCTKEEEGGTTDGTTDGTGGGSGGGEVTLTCTTDSVNILKEPTDGSASETASESFEYNADGKIERINMYSDGSLNEYVVITYNSDGTMASATEYDSRGVEDKSYTYTYSDGKIATIVEEGTDGGDAYVFTTTLTYVAGELASTSTVTTSGTAEPDSPNMENMVWTDGNITSVDMSAGPAGSVTMTASYDDKDNIEAIVSYPKDGGDLISYQSANNLELVVAATTNLLMEINAGDTVLYHTYSYDSEDNVEVMVQEAAGFDADQKETYTYDWTCE